MNSLTCEGDNKVFAAIVARPRSWGCVIFWRKIRDDEPVTANGRATAWHGLSKRGDKGGPPNCDAGPLLATLSISAHDSASVVSLPILEPAFKSLKASV